MEFFYGIFYGPGVKSVTYKQDSIAKEKKWMEMSAIKGGGSDA